MIRWSSNKNLTQKQASYNRNCAASRANPPQTPKIFAPSFLLHPQVHVLGLPSYFNQTRVCKFLKMMRKSCPGDGNFRPQITAGNFSFYRRDPFENFEPPTVHESLRYPMQRPFVHYGMRLNSAARVVPWSEFVPSCIFADCSSCCSITARLPV